jgi:hypothetical protein
MRWARARSIATGRASTTICGPSSSRSAASPLLATTELAVTRRARHAAAARVALSALLLGLPLAALAQAPLSPQQIEDQIGRELGVQVLAVTPVEADGGARYAVKVMNPPGNYNGAFLVSTLLVDAVSGEVVGEAGPEGGLVRPIQVPASDAESGLEARRRTYR